MVSIILRALTHVSIRITPCEFSVMQSIRWISMKSCSSDQANAGERGPEFLKGLLYSRISIPTESLEKAEVLSLILVGAELCVLVIASVSKRSEVEYRYFLRRRCSRDKNSFANWDGEGMVA